MGLQTADTQGETHRRESVLLLSSRVLINQQVVIASLYQGVRMKLL